jgi:hypothetical protein
VAEQRQRRASGAPFEAGLHHPDVAHVGDETALDRQFLGLPVKHLVDRRIERRNAVLSAGLQVLPAFQHLVPEQAGEQEADRDVLAGAHALVGA